MTAAAAAEQPAAAASPATSAAAEPTSMPLLRGGGGGGESYLEKLNAQTRTIRRPGTPAPTPAGAAGGTAVDGVAGAAPLRGSFSKQEVRRRCLHLRLRLRLGADR